ncbi:sulfotransferase [Temperatibacter marinus]|uniref:Sulfotransferase n=1 Tax=Temperatibacter marinus TaxID=1456591 RepID=A0AA52HB96_9PROT|nr:sulfotransferase [Temperatibacter marinus]WND03413.1 sulfotransferase [Temperatibacter marinus]
MKHNQIRSRLHAGYQAYDQGQYQEAKQHGITVLALDAGAVEAHFLVGLASVELGDWGTARKAFGTVLGLDQKHARSWVYLARTLLMTGEHADALASAENAEKLGLINAQDFDSLGVIYAHLNQHEKALQQYDQALKLKDQSAIIHVNKASSQTFLGQSEAAIDSLNQALKIDPAHAKAHWMLARSQKATSEEDLDPIKETLKASNSPQDVAMLAYGLGKLYEDLGAWDQAFTTYEKGANAKKAFVSYDAAGEAQYFQAQMKAWTREHVESVCRQNDQQESPIFIVGQPRTGTTLVERILAAHSEVTAAGELPYVAMLANQFRSAPKAFGEAYLNCARPLRGQTRLFIDKLPENYQHLGLLATAFPKARFIHVKRHPMDSCFSMYKQLFAESYPYSYDFEDLARHYAHYQGLMDHWHNVLPDRILDLAYEDLVRDVEGSARCLLDHVGLDWQEACASPHRTEGTVATASALQVREKAHTKSIGVWQRFEKDLQPLYTQLNQLNIKGL